MKQKLLAFASFLRITDENDQVSLTNLALMVVIAKVATTNAASITDIAGLLIALISYQSKKLINLKSQTITDDAASALQTQLNTTKTTLEDISSKVSAVALAAGFKPR